MIRASRELIYHISINRQTTIHRRRHSIDSSPNSFERLMDKLMMTRWRWPNLELISNQAAAAADAGRENHYRLQGGFNLKTSVRFYKGRLKFLEQTYSVFTANSNNTCFYQV